MTEVEVDDKYQTRASYVRNCRRTQLKMTFSGKTTITEIMKLEDLINDAQAELLSYLKAKHPKRFHLHIQKLTDADVKQIMSLDKTKVMDWLTLFVKVVVKKAELYDIVVFNHNNMYGYPFFLDETGWHGTVEWRREDLMYFVPPIEYFNFLEHLGLTQNSAVGLFTSLYGER